MDLATVKASVKAWEKAFKNEHGRAPTKQDIKADTRGIADEYALYRKLAKAAQAASASQPASQPPSSAAPSSSSAHSAGPSRTPRNIPSNEYPTTPTPHSRRTSQSTVDGQGTSKQDVSRPSKRPVPEPETGISPRRSQSFITPKKPRPSYSGPIVDPNPINPFSATPPKRSPFSTTVGQGDPAPAPAASPFLHASSPRKLRELLQSNSLRKVRQRMEDEITPRTKARRRLAGDFITPVKDKAPTRKRGEAVDRESKAKGKEAMRFEDEAIHEEDEDEFGPSPMKVGPTRTFTELLQTVEEPKSAGRGGKAKEDKAAGKQKDLLGFFGRIANPQAKARPTDTKQSGPSKQPKATQSITVIAATPPPSSPAQDLAMASPRPAEIEIDQQPDSDRLSTPPAAPDLDQPDSQSTPSRTSRAPKIVSFSDDEVDEWDPEGGRIQRRVVITGTRRNVQRRGSLSDSEDSEVEENAPESEENGMDQDILEDDETAPALTYGGTTTSTRSSPAPLVAPPMLSLLSLRSPPSRRGKMDDLRVRAIFNPLDAARLKAAKKGQDVYVSGEGWDGEDDEEVLDRLEYGDADEEDEEGDDDWEEENEGWKRTELGMDDEEW